MDLTKLSDADLLALQQNDLTKLSDAGLAMLSTPNAPVKTDVGFGETGGGAATGRPMRNVQLNVQAKPRPLEAVGAGVVRGAMIDPILGTAKLVSGGKLGQEASQRYAEESKPYKEASPIGFGVGQVGGSLVPASVVLKGSSMIPSFANSQIAQNVITGTTMGLLTPEETGKTGADFYKQQSKEGAIGGTIGAALPLAGAAYQGGKSLVEPFYQVGRERILGRALRESAGGEADKAVANLRSYKPTVAGTNLTVGEAAGVPSMAATQRSVMATSQEATNLAAARQTANAKARTEALESIASPTRMSKYSTIRNEMGDELYTPALNKAMDFSNLSKSMQDEVASLVKAPAIKRAMVDARKNALNRGEDILDPKGSLTGLHKTKIALDDKIDDVKSMLEKNGKTTSDELDGLKAAKTRLLGFIETVSPEYKVARETYARLSKPVEQLESIQKLAEKAVSNKDREIYAGRYFNELENIKKQGVLSSRQIQRLEDIADDLRKVDFGQSAGRGVGSDTVQKLAYNNMLKQAGIPNMLQNLPAGQIVGNLATRAGDVFYGRANKQLTNELAEALMNPSEAARLMEMAAKGKSNKSSELARLLMLQPANQIIGVK
jgi:hypothetical protein